jgi:hypothetical protein
MAEKNPSIVGSGKNGVQREIKIWQTGITCKLAKD